MPPASKNASGPPGLLRLNPDTRRLIYEHAGLASKNYYGTPCPAVYNISDPAAFRASRTTPELEAGFQTFHGLLLCCRTVYVEASALLYSANRFVVRYQPARTLAPLRALSPRALASLTHLKVVLNQTSCHHERAGHEGNSQCCGADPEFKATPCCYPQFHVDNHDPPLDASSGLSQAVFTEWHETAAYLASHIVPGRLELSLVCDVQHNDREAAQLVLDGLRLLPPLKDCHIRVCGTREPQLQRLVQDAVLRARGITSLSPGPAAAASPAPPRPYLVNLPRELRLRILEYTDLVTPWKEVQWSRWSNGYQIERPRCELLACGIPCRAEFHHGCQFTQCWKTPQTEPSVGCFCRRRHTAFSSRCRCWAPPTPLFRVCRALYADASKVLYNHNRLIVVDSLHCTPAAPMCPGDYSHQTFAASQFLRHVVPPHCLWHIRFLELVFGPITHLCRPRDGHPAIQDWSNTLDWVKHELNLPALTLRVVMAPDIEGPSVSITKAQGKEVLAVYNSILAPLRSLGAATDRGLARFYADLHWPLRWSREVMAKREKNEEDTVAWVDSKDRELKRRTEQHVMGARYEGGGIVGSEPEKSVWTWSAYQIC